MLDKCDNVAISGVLWSVDEMVMWIDFFFFLRYRFALWGTSDGLLTTKPRAVSVSARVGAQTYVYEVTTAGRIFTFILCNVHINWLRKTKSTVIGYRSLWRGKHGHIGVAIRINSGNFKINVPWSSPARWRVRFTRKELLLNQNISYK